MKRTLKIIALVLALGLLLGLGWFANAMVGNPISKALATRSAEAYLTQHLPNTDYVLERVTYSFKDGNYHAFYTSPTAIDGDFSADFDWLGRYTWDTYDSVTNKFNTASRLDMDYRTLCDTVLEAPDSPYGGEEIAFGTLEICPGAYINQANHPDIPAYTLPQEELVLNGTYDIRRLGAQAGHLVIYVTDTPTPNTAADYLLDIRSRMDAAGVPFRAIDLTLRDPETDADLHLLDFAAADITAEGLIDRVTAAAKAAADYYAALDKEKMIDNG